MAPDLPAPKRRPRLSCAFQTGKTNHTNKPTEDSKLEEGPQPHGAQSLRARAAGPGRRGARNSQGPRLRPSDTRGPGWGLEEGPGAGLRAPRRALPGVRRLPQPTGALGGDPIPRQKGGKQEKKDKIHSKDAQLNMRRSRRPGAGQATPGLPGPEGRPRRTAASPPRIPELLPGVFRRVRSGLHTDEPQGHGEPMPQGLRQRRLSLDCEEIWADTGSGAGAREPGAWSRHGGRGLIAPVRSSVSGRWQTRHVYLRQQNRHEQFVPGTISGG